MSVVLQRQGSRTVRHKSVFADRSGGSSHAGPADLGHKMSKRKTEQRLGKRIHVRSMRRKGARK